MLTERLKMLIASDREKFGALEAISESPEFTGHLIWALWNDPALARPSSVASSRRIMGSPTRVASRARIEYAWVVPFSYYPVVIR